MADRKHKKIKHQHEVGDLHELTFSCYHKLRLLTNDVWRMRLSECITSACDAHEFELVAFVYMPDHVHLLVFPTSLEPDMGTFLSDIKQPFSSSIRQLLEASESLLLEKLMVRERPGKMVFRFWQEGPGCDRNLFRPESILASINYIHKNPVERNLCSLAIDWRWSSARYYLTEPSKQQYLGLPYVHGLRPEALDDGPSRF
jgi:putative transposase